jgi:hypothetical protein
MRLTSVILLLKDSRERVSALQSQPQSNAKAHDDVRIATTRIKLVVPLW